ncbi:hypothetical protein ACP70R_039015 [Stipagrostis hirtigluma subsp. patula]
MLLETSASAAIWMFLGLASLLVLPLLACPFCHRLRLFLVDLSLAVATFCLNCIGLAFDIGRRVNFLGDEIERLRKTREIIQEKLVYKDPQPSSQVWREWLLNAQALQLRAAEIKVEHDERHHSSFGLLTKWRLQKAVQEALERASCLDYQGRKLVSYEHARQYLMTNIKWKKGQDSYGIKVLEFVEPSPVGASSLLGISGMRGIGKTSLLRLVRNSYMNNKSFDFVFYAEVGTGCTVGDLQLVLAWDTGFSSLPLTSNVPLAKIISSFLADKTFLLLLDDVRERLDLSAIGMPMPLGYQQKVIFTTRDQAICAEMGCDGNTIQMQRLEEDDAWDLFRERVGGEMINGDPMIEDLAKQGCRVPRCPQRLVYRWSMHGNQGRHQAMDGRLSYHEDEVPTSP